MKPENQGKVGECNFVLVDGYKSCYFRSRADQNTGGALLEFPVRTAMHLKSLVPSAISVCDN